MGYAFFEAHPRAWTRDQARKALRGAASPGGVAGRRAAFSALVGVRAGPRARSKLRSKGGVCSGDRADSGVGACSAMTATKRASSLPVLFDVGELPDEVVGAFDAEQRQERFLARIAVLAQLLASKLSLQQLVAKLAAGLHC